jgi:predicted PurR-regulated permease PerM
MTAAAARDTGIRVPSRRALLTIAALALVLAVLYLGREALTPFIVGLLLVYLLAPGVELLARRGTPRWLAILVLYAVVALVIIEGLALLTRPLISQLALFVSDAPRYAAAIRDLLDSLSRAYQSLDLPPEVRALVDDGLARLTQALGGLNPGVLLPVATSLAALVGNVVGYLIIPVWAFYVLKDRSELLAGLYTLLPPSWRDEARAIAHIVDRVVGRWLRGQLLLGLVVGVVTFVGLLLLGALVDPIFARLAVLLAVIAGFLELLPIIGPTIAAIPAALVGITVSVEATLVVIALYVVIQLLENYLLVPKIQGDAVRLHPAVVIFALVIGGTIAGLIGAILALPVTAVAREIYEYLAGKLPEGDGAVQTPTATEAADTEAADTVATRAKPAPRRRRAAT